jgi:Tfp pilus assembly protein PilW
MSMKRTARSQMGLSLIELMVGIVVGMIVVGGVIAIYTTTVRGGTYVLRAAKLNQELRATMDVMANDIRRAGHIDSTALGTTNPFAKRDSVTPANHRDLTVLTSSVAGDCVMYSYDATYRPGNTAGSVDATDFFGFRQDGDHVDMFQSGATSTSNCSAGSWEGVTDPNTVVVDSLRFSTVGSRCLNTSVSPVVSWQSAAGSTTPACEDTAATGYVLPTAGDNLVETRVIRITLIAHHKDDAATTATLTQQVRVMNERLVN